MEDSKGPMLMNVHICLITLSSLLTISRVYARGFMTKALGLDDALCFLAFVRLYPNTSWKNKYAYMK